MIHCLSVPVQAGDAFVCGRYGNIGLKIFIQTTSRDEIVYNNCYRLFICYDFIGINRLRCVKEAIDVTLGGTMVILVPFCVIKATHFGY